MKKITKVLIYIGSAALVLGAFIPLCQLPNQPLGSLGSNDPYHLELHKSLTSEDLAKGRVSFLTSYGNPVEFTFDSELVEVNKDGLLVLKAGGTFKNSSMIKGISKVDISLLGTVSLKVGYSNDSIDTDVKTFSSYAIGKSVSDTFTLEDSANYFCLEATEDTKIDSLDIFYSCIEASPALVNLKTAVFADIQLQKKDNDANLGKPNSGITAHAYLALKNHFALCKEQGVDAIMMVGDIINNASSNYYDLYNSTLKEVYGSDTSKYPAIIATMGNHEWWDLNEKETEGSVKMFNDTFFNESDATKVTSVKFSLDGVTTLPTYYRVYKGVPFLMVSGENSNGLIGTTMKSEIKGWLEEISNLPSVRNGGPIYVGYHYPLSTTLTHGSNSLKQALVLEELLKDYPQAIVFTGDTHYSGVNERAINQVDFTTINIGSSSYSRMDKRSATMGKDESFYNLEAGKDKTVGSGSFRFEYTPTIHMMNTYDNGRTVLNRYFSTDNASEPTLINKPWTIPAYSNKSNFMYTNDRFVNKASAEYCYGADGVSWSEDANIRFAQVDEDKVIVQFDDTKQYHYTEHFKITLTSSASVNTTYDVFSNYYKYSLEPESLNYIISDVRGTITSVSVQAFDYFDNPSLNTLTANAPDPEFGFEKIDEFIGEKYSDISQRINIEDTAPNSKSSLEYYYNGVMKYQYGAITSEIIIRVKEDLNVFDNPFISLNDDLNQEVHVKAKVKNLTNDPLIVGLTVTQKNVVDGNIQEACRSDFGGETQQTVPANSDWVELDWNLYELYQFTSKDDIFQVNIKTKSTVASNDGYVMHFLVDDIDIYSKGKVARIETLEDGYENMLRDTGWENCNAEIDKTVSASEESSSSLKCTFAGRETDYWNVFGPIFSPEHQGISNQINATSGIFTAKFKFSEDIKDYRVRLILVDSKWKAARYDIDTKDLGNGWYELRVDFANMPAFWASDDGFTARGIIRFGFGFHGVNSDNSNTATVWVDEVVWPK